MANAATSSGRSIGRWPTAAWRAASVIMRSTAREVQQPVIGRVIGNRLTDELSDRVALIVDGVDGRTQHVALSDRVVAADAPIGSIVEISRAPAGQRPADRNIAALATDTGVYRPSEHRAMAEAGHIRVPGGAMFYIGSHVHRLEALRRAGIVERLDADRWSIPEDYAARASANDSGVELVSHCNHDLLRWCVDPEMQRFAHLAFVLNFGTSRNGILHCGNRTGI